MSGERPVPVGTLNSPSCASDRNQYLETGELNQSAVGGSSRVGPSVPKSSRGDRESRHSTSVMNNSGFQMSNPYSEAGPLGFEEPNRSWSRTGYYETDPPPSDYSMYNGRGHRDRDPYYGHGNDYGPPRRTDPYFREMGRGYGGPPYRPDPAEYYPQEAPYNGWNRQSKNYHSLPRPATAKNEHLTSYLQEFRARDPVGYKKWYRQYKEHKANPDRVPEPLVPGFPPHAARQSQYAPPHYPPQHRVDRRAPHRYGQPNQYDDQRENVVPPSGRSSVTGNGSIFQSEFEDRDESESEHGFPADSFSIIETAPDRLTPQKFSSGHSIGVITPIGHLLKVSSGSRTIEIHHVKTLMKNLPEYHELDSFPGPLVRGRTNKTTLIKFCQKKIKGIQNQEPQLDRENLILIWELLILLVKQNGSVVGSDIAEILLKKRASLEILGGADSGSNNNSDAEDDGEDGDRDSGVSTAVASSATISGITSTMNDPKITQKFCDRLLLGHKNDALDYAMDKGLWGHALFLASKMGEREYGQVMARFANGVAYNDPLQTLYQIMSGRVPSSVTGCLGDGFGDWRPHLAMIVSNAGIRPDVEQKALLTLGDTLRNKNLIYGAQFCHLMAQSSFSEDSKLGPLLGLSPDRSNVLEATQMSEIYEFAMSLGDTRFNLGSHFLRSKFEYVKNLIDFGFTPQAFSYCETIAKQLGTLGEKAESLRWDLIRVGERLKHVDLSNNSDWVQDLRTALTESQTTDDSATSSRRGSYPPSGISSVDQGSPASGPNNVDMTSEPVSQVPLFNPVGLTEQSEQIPNQDRGAYDPNPPMYEFNPVPMLPATNTQQQPYPNEFQPKTEFDSHGQQPSWNIPAPINQEISNWGTNTTSPYLNPGLNQQGTKQGDQNPVMFQPQQQKGHGIPLGGVNTEFENNNDIHYPPPGSHGATSSSGIGNGYPGMMDPQTQYQPYPTYNTLPPQSSSLTQNAAPRTTQQQQPANAKRKTVRFEDDEDDGGGRMSRSQALNILRRIESDDVTETSEEEETTKVPPVQYKSTYPIDTPLGHRLQVTAPPLRTSKVNSVKTFPIDRKCCDALKPCPEHNPFQIPPSGSAGLNFNSAKDESQRKNQEKKVESKGEGKKPAKESTSNTNKGGLFGWLGLRPKNQMILPDDKEPSIVWDDTKKAWVNAKGEEDESSGPRGPPPKDSELNPQQPPQQQQMGYGNPPPPNFQPMNYGQGQQRPQSTVPDGPPSFNPQFNQSNPGSMKSENWGSQNPTMAPVPAPASLNYNQLPLQPNSGPQSLNPQQQQQLQPPTPASNNMNKYKLPKSGRAGLRGKYVDVFAGNAGGPQQQPIGMAPPSMMSPLVGNGPGGMFVPAADQSEEFQ